MTTLPIERIAELERLDAEVDRCRKIADEGNDGFYMQVTYAEDELGHALARDSKALLAAARELEQLKSALCALDKADAVLLTPDGLRFAPDEETALIAAEHVGWSPTGKAGT